MDIEMIERYAHHPVMKSCLVANTQEARLRGFWFDKDDGECAVSDTKEQF